MHPMYVYLWLSQAQLPPMPLDAIIFALFNQANQCRAKLEYYGTALSSSEQTAIVTAFESLSAARNLSLILNNNPLTDRISCEIGFDQPSQLDVTYCHRMGKMSIAGALKFAYLEDLFSASEVRALLEQATRRDCGASPLIYVGYVLAGFLTLGVLALIGLSCRKSLSKCRTHHVNTIDETCSEDTASTTSEITQRGPHLFQIKANTDDDHASLRQPML